MAVLLGPRLSELRRAHAKLLSDRGDPVTSTKPQLNTAFQDVEDQYVNTSRADLRGAIDTGQPGVFTAPQRTDIVNVWRDEA